MAKITALTFEMGPGSTIDTLLLRVTTTLRFTDFDRNTRLEYLLTFRLLGIGSQFGGLPPGPV